MVQLIKFNHKCMHNHLSPNIPKYNSRGKMHFHKNCVCFFFFFVCVCVCTIPLDSCTVVTS